MAESGWGKINDGQLYGILAVDVDRALALAGLGTYEQIVMQFVREHSWGVTRRKGGRSNPWPEAKPVKVNFTRLADDLKVPRQRLQDARRSLVASRMLLESEAGLTVNKRADEWLDPKDPSRGRLNPSMLSYAARAINVDHTRPDDAEPSKDARHSVHSMDASTARHSVQKCEHGVHATACSKCTVQRAPVNATACSSERYSVHPHDKARAPDPTGLDPTGSRSHQTGDGGGESSTGQGWQDFEAAVSMVAEASSRIPQLEATATRMRAARRTDADGAIDAIGSDGWRWQHAARLFLSEAGAAVRSAKSVDRHWGWLRKVARDATEQDRDRLLSPGVGRRSGRRASSLGALEELIQRGSKSA